LGIGVWNSIYPDFIPYTGIENNHLATIGASAGATRAQLNR